MALAMEWAAIQERCCDAARGTSVELPFTARDDWRYRWLCIGRWNRLHRVVAGEASDEDMVGVRNGRTACGLVGDLEMPGLLSRMGTPRCAHCCRIVGVPCGKGAPFNSGIDA